MTYRGIVRIVRPDPGYLTFGRGDRSDTHLHIGPCGSQDDSNISRIAGSVRLDVGRWMLRNESSTRPIVVMVGAQDVTLVSRTLRDQLNEMAIDVRGVTVRLTTKTCTYEITFVPAVGNLGAGWEPERPDGLSTPEPLPPPTAHDRAILAAKFFSRARPGDAIGDARTASRVNRVRSTAQTIGPRAVEGVVRRWKERLEQQLGHTDLGERHGIHRIGALLVQHGTLTDRDRLKLPVVEYDDHDDEEP